jgi:hypothetical protein
VACRAAAIPLPAKLGRQKWAALPGFGNIDWGECHPGHRYVSGSSRRFMPRFTNCCATRTFPSCIYFNRRAKHFPGSSARSIRRKGRHASASSFPELCDSNGLRHYTSRSRVFARVSGNVGTTNGLHARRLAAMRRASPRCGEDRGLLTAKYSATQRTVPRGF